MEFNKDSLIPPFRIFTEIFHDILHGQNDLAELHKGFFGHSNALAEYAASSPKRSSLATAYVATLSSVGYSWKKNMLKDFSKKLVKANARNDDELLRKEILMMHAREIACTFNSHIGGNNRPDGLTLHSECLNILDSLHKCPELKDVEVLLDSETWDKITMWEDFIYNQKYLERPLENYRGFIEYSMVNEMAKQRNKRIYKSGQTGLQP